MTITPPTPPQEPSDRHLAHITDQFEAIFNSSFDGIWICDGQGVILRVNPASERINGIKAAEVVGRNVRDLAGMGVVDQSVSLEVLDKGRRVTILQRALKTGAKLLVTGTPVHGPDGRIAMVITNDRDITELDNLRHKLLESEARSERYQHELIKLELEEATGARMIGRSPAMERVLAAAGHVARFDTSVLLTGPSGTGKSMLAKSVHLLSDRSEGPFVRVDCGSIPVTLFESEIFGYERGAFTGARQSGKLGLFEMAHQGTLFLDDIAAVPTEVQPKLLKFLENRELARVGGARPIQVDARLIAASNQDLEAEVAAGRFREDLFYRLNVVPLHLPPLKDRQEDIPLLIRHFIDEFNVRYGTRARLSGPALEKLMAYDWPGNVRELRNLVERMVVMTPGPVVEISDLPSKLRPALDPAFSWAQSPGGLKAAIRRLETSMIDEALRIYGTQAKAAEALGVSQATVARKRGAAA
jgi:PAS domain S-box-containing protein